MKRVKKEGFSWSLYLFLTLGIVKPLVMQEDIALQLLVMMVPFYLFAGFLMAATLRYLVKTKN